MQIAIRYHTRSGNTQKLAEAISSAIGVPAETVATPLTEKVDILFLGCSYYAFDMDEAVKRFITENQAMIGRVVCFGTSAMMKSMKKPMKKVLTDTKIELADEEFHCRGEFGKFHRGSPNDRDLADAAEFARRLIS